MRILLAVLLGFFVSDGLVGFIAAKKEIKLLHVTFRHGDKIPVKKSQSYPTDPHGNYSYYPVDDGDLTIAGKQRGYRLGLKLRERYGKFLGQCYSTRLVYAQSTEVPRVQMTLRQVLLGLFPPVEEQRWSSRLFTQPFFLHYTPRSSDGLLFSKLCKVYKEKRKEVLARRDVKEKIEKYKWTMKYLANHTNKIVDQTLAVAHLYNLFKEQKAHNLTLSNWINTVFPYPMGDILHLDFDILSYTTLLKRLNAGPLLRKITEDIKAVKAGTLEPSGRKAFLYAVHEVNIASMARTLGLEGLAIPQYTSAIAFETLQDETGQYYIEVFVWTGVDTEWKYQMIPNCHPCRLEKFLEIYKNVIPTAKEADCFSPEYPKNITLYLENNNIILDHDDKKILLGQ